MSTPETAARIAVASLFTFAAVVSAQPFGGSLGAGAVRLLDSQAHADAPPPSFFIENLRPKLSPIAPDYPVMAEFATAEGRRTASIAIPQGSLVMGLGAHAGPVARSGFASSTVSCPWVLVVRPDGSAFGVLADTGYACAVSVGSEVRFTSDAPVLPVLAITGDSPWTVLTTLNEVTGRLEMPPRWSLRYQHEVPGDPARIRAVAEWFRKSELSAGAFWVPSAATPPFPGEPGPAAAEKVLLSDLVTLGVQSVIAVSPTVRASGSILESAKEHWTLGDDGQPIRIAAGSTLLPDFARAGTRQWWSGLMTGVADLGFRGAVVLPTGSWPEADGARVQADDELGGQDVAARYAGILPSLFARATRDGMGGEAADRRPLVMSGGYWPGMQRFAGLLIEPDDTVPDPHRAALSRVISAGVSGQPFVGLRMPTAADPRVQSIWIGLGSCLPLMQGSFALDPAAPVAEGVTSSLRRALKLRAQIEPYLYTLCFDAFFRCQPIVNPVLVPDEANGGFRISDTAFLLGKDLLVVPRLGADPKPASPLPGWRRLALGDADPDLPDLYLRPGAILPVVPSQVVENGPELQLLVYLENGMATGVLYEDDGDGYSFYRNKCRRAVYRAEAKDDGVFLRLSGLDGGLPIPKRRVEVVLMAADGDPIRAIGSERGTIRITPGPHPRTPESTR